MVYMGLHKQWQLALVKQDQVYDNMMFLLLLTHTFCNAFFVRRLPLFKTGQDIFYPTVRILTLRNKECCPLLLLFVLHIRCTEMNMSDKVHILQAM